MAIRDKSLLLDEESINLLTTLLVRYPELCTINYSPQGNVLRLSFIVKKEVREEEIRDFESELSLCINAYLHFESGIKPKRFRVHHYYGPGITVIDIARDTETLTQKEIGLLIDYIKEKYLQDIACEELYGDESELSQQDDFIGSLLERFRRNNPAHRLIAVREEGKVLVFQR